MLQRTRKNLAIRLLAPTVLLCLPLAACGPSPEDVCTHVAELIEEDLGSEPEGFVEECVEDETRMKEIKGMLWKEAAKCAMDAKTLEDLDGC